jgi:GDP-L-fucose synthase
MMQKESKIYVAGHNGMVGSAITRALKAQGYENLVFTPYPPYDLTNQAIVAEFFEKERPEYVFLAAAKVGGIIANNTYRAQFIYENLMIQNNIIHQSFKKDVKKLLFLGSSCIYPKDAPQPIKENYLLTDELEYTNEPYAIAKIAGIKMCESYNLQYGTNYISVMPTNLFGPNDNYNLETSHVLPAMIRKMHLAKCLSTSDWSAIKKDISKNPVSGLNEKSSEDEMLTFLRKYGIEISSENKNNGSGKEVTLKLWGTGTPFREFLHVDDVADACVFVMNKVDFNDVKPGGKEVRNTHINIGTGRDLTIKQLAEKIKSIIGFEGRLQWDDTKPDGTFRKLLDVSKINSLGWKEKIGMEEGIRRVYSLYQNNS